MKSNLTFLSFRPERPPERRGTRMWKILRPFPGAGPDTWGGLGMLRLRFGACCARLKGCAQHDKVVRLPN